MILLIIIAVISLAAIALAGLTFLRHMKEGLGASADLQDLHSWGLHIQAFFFFGALAGGLLMFSGFTHLVGSPYQAYAPVAVAAALGCLAGGGILLVADLGRPLRSLFLMKPGGNLKSPINWDFACFSLCGVIGLLYMFGLVSGRFAGLWAVLAAGSGFVFLMAHTHFLLTRDGELTRSPFLALDMLAGSLWGGVAVLAIVVFLMTGGWFPLLPMSVLLLATGIAAALTSLAQALPSPALKPHAGALQRFAASAVLVLVCLVCALSSWSGGVLLILVSLCILALLFTSKAQHLHALQDAPLFPEPFGHFEPKAAYKPTRDEWILFAGGVGVAVIAGIIVWHLMKLFA